MKHRRRVKRAPIIVQFWDHSMGKDLEGDRLLPLRCEVMGLLVYEDDLYIRVASWVTNGEVDNPNNEMYAILKSTIIRRKVIK
jgi:hypothetical protein